MILGILLYRQIRKTENKALRLTGVILFILLFFYIFPDFAATFEAQRVLFFEQENGDMIEGFNLLYVWGRFPTYWLMGLSIVLIDKLKRKKRTTTTVAVAQPTPNRKSGSF